MSKFIDLLQTDDDPITVRGPFATYNDVATSLQEKGADPTYCSKIPTTLQQRGVDPRTISSIMIYPKTNMVIIDDRKSQD